MSSATIYCQNLSRLRHMERVVESEVVVWRTLYRSGYSTNPELSVQRRDVGFDWAGRSESIRYLADGNVLQ